MSEPVLKVRDLVKTFGPVKALDGAGITLRAGEIHSLMGENGAGKSTLIKVLTGVHSPDGGIMELDGRTIQPRSTRDAEALGISTVYQEVNLIPTLSIADNILLGRQPTRCGFLQKKRMRQRAQTALGRLGLILDVRRPVGSCSMAEQQLVAISRALDIQARVLILDEPTSSLDEREVEFLFKILRRLRDDGMALLLVTHFIDQVYTVSDRISVLRNGAFVGEYRAAELPRLELISAMLGRAFEDVQQLRADAAELEPAKTGAFLDAVGIGKRGVLAPMDISIAAGEVAGLAGLLGSGRTETARILFGIEPADSGTLKISGQPVSIRSPLQAMKQGLAFCPEDRKSEGIIPHLSVRENIILAIQATRGPLKLLPRAEQETLAAHYVRTLNIRTADAETPVMNLSGGNQQKVLLARWLLTQPRLIILDEPTRGIDVGAKAEIEKLVQTLRQQGMAVLFISSDIEEMVRTCQRVVVLRDRRKIGELSGTDVQPDRIMNVIAHHEG
ncbi:MAG: galactofuranose transport system ATP-binding protein [Verrucomicrobiota bacterium]|jgi:simple sugar transport system ATP-binding protein